MLQYTMCRQYFYLFMLLLTAELPFLFGAEEGSLQEVVEKLELYDQDATARQFIKVLSLSYNEKMEEFLTEFITDLEPTVIAIQNITFEKFKILSKQDIMTQYEVSGIKIDDTVSDKDIVNPIFYQGDRLQPPVMEEKFTGVETSEKHGQISWAQFHIVDVSRSKANRQKRDLGGNSMMEGIFQALQTFNGGERTDDCNVPGTIVVVNANLVNSGVGAEADLLRPIYKNVLCRRRKKTFLAGNVGWRKSHSALYRFAKTMLKVKTFNINNKRNLNQIWAHDFETVRDITANIRTYKSDDITTTVAGDKFMMVAPTFAAFHYDSIRTE